MTHFQLSYDLRGATRQHYRRISSAIRGMGDVARATQSEWLIATSMSESDVRRMIVMHVGRGSGLLTAFNGCVVHHGLSVEAMRWLERHGYLPGSDLDLAA